MYFCSNSLSLVLAGTLLLGSATSQAELTAQLEDGTVLRGTPLGWNAETRTLAIQTGLSDQPLNLPLDKISQLLPDPLESAAAADEYQILLELSNGDTLQGHLISFALDQAELVTPFGSVMVDPDMIASIRRDNSRNSLFHYQGKRDATIWRTEGASLEDDGIRFDGRGNLIAALNLPSSYRMSLEFNCPFEDLALGLDLHVGPNGDTQWNSPAYNLVLSAGGGASVLNRNQGIQGDQNKSVVNGNPNSRGTCQLEILVDRHAGIMAISANGGPNTIFEGLPAFPNFDDAQALNGPGGGMIMMNGGLVENAAQIYAKVTNRSNQAVTLSEFCVENWEAPASGLFSQRRLPASAEDEHSATLNLVNGDVLVGRLTSIDEDFYELRIGGVPIPVARERVSQIDAPAGENEARRRRDDLRLELDGKICLTLELSDLRDGVLIGTSDNFSGSLSIPLERCTAINANLYRDLIPPLHPHENGPPRLDLFETNATSGNLQGQPIIGLPIGN